ncbi:hypothetical protein BASA81_006540 [Batrachochytrium salamandrivorans]|nr:hypothetical protein BASA81_006540 [Batrachochytrium salamandrivorans]
MLARQRRPLSMYATPLLKKNKLDKAFSECDTQQQLEELVLSASKYDFNSWNVMTAFSRLGRLLKPTNDAVYAKLLEIERDMRRPEAGEQKFSQHELETIATGVALGPLASKLPPFVVKGFLQLPSFAEFTPNALTNLSYATGKLKHVDFELEGKLISELVDKRGELKDFSPNQLSVLAQTLGWWYTEANTQLPPTTSKDSYGRDVRLPDPVSMTKRDELFAKLTTALVANSDALTGNQLANALNGTLRVGYSGAELFDFACQKFDVSKLAKTQEITNLLRAVAEKKPTHSSEFVEKLAPVLTKFHNQFTPKQIQSVFASLAALGWSTPQSKPVLKVLKKEVARRGLEEHLDAEALQQSFAKLSL